MKSPGSIYQRSAVVDCTRKLHGANGKSPVHSKVAFIKMNSNEKRKEEHRLLRLVCGHVFEGKTFQEVLFDMMGLATKKKQRCEEIRRGHTDRVAVRY